MTIMQMIEKRNKAIEAAHAFAAAHKNENNTLNDADYAEYEQIDGFKAKLEQDTSYKGLWTVDFTL